MENWKPIAAYEGLYEVSDLGRVRSLDRWITRPQGGYIKSGRVIAQQSREDGRLQVQLCDGTPKGFKVHILVARAFVKVPDNLVGKNPDVNHCDGNYLNNQATNLEWRTRLGNHQHAAKHKLHGDGIHFIERLGKWAAQYSPAPYGKKHIGCFDTKEAAQTARDAAVASIAHTV